MCDITVILRKNKLKSILIKYLRNSISFKIKFNKNSVDANYFDHKSIKQNFARPHLFGTARLTGSYSLGLIKVELD